MARAIGVVSDAWSLLIVRDALRGASRFGNFRKGLGLTKNILADRLRKLVAAGILEARPVAAGGPHNEYLLTDRGRELSVVLIALAGWGGSHAFPSGETYPSVVDRRDRRPVRIIVAAEDGRELEPGDVTVASAGPSS